MRIPAGLWHGLLATDFEKETCELFHPLILITSRPVLRTGQVRGMIEGAARQRRSLLLIAPRLTAEVVSELVSRRLRAGPVIGAVGLPAAWLENRPLLEDLAMAVGAGVFAGQTEPPWEELEASSPLIGSARFVAARRDSTTISGGAGDQTALRSRILELVRQMASTDRGGEKDQLWERLENLSSCLRPAEAA